jgi:2Fe-2S ferredoxin
MPVNLKSRTHAAFPSRTIAGTPSLIDLSVKTRDGLENAVQARPGLTLMEAIRKAAIYELVAMCGGSCSCATCHVYVESGPDDLQRPASEDENDLLDTSDHRQANSRLACQIRLTEAVNGLVVQIAPEG